MPFALYLAIALVSAACAHHPCPREVPMEQLARLDAPLRHVVAEYPDSVVGVLLRTTHPPTEEEQRELARAGLQAGVVVGDILTGRLRACDAPRVAELKFVRYMELARTVPVPRPVVPE